MKRIILVICLLLSGVTFGKNNMTQKENNSNVELASFGAGCFWCVEAIFQELKGVDKVVSGYMGGETKNPSYREVCSGETGYAEICQITFDPKIISYDELLEVFWSVHNPTTLNRQGADVGTQYRSVIFYNSEKQKELAEAYKKKLNDSGAFENPIVTEISKAPKFYPAENYHQEYFNNNGQQPYCTFVIKPKMDKFKKVFKEKLK
ncbi:peptide-methionine (S)-S-oxide reductase MsrA [Ancylomarina longa]|uniref:Peptide methionine sulfoxide reductase MsrA n=1 Tax=Ancylomarina longa TaxID=2487017 RepID=A0A434AF53_9BACT|nr:peptide-methionine (S)-S-oxide reductase MsrA [Ancylomarina longa]RUT73000.1 peptide-methionine (S)-S-oxide reductase [Ancylomarina longa]